MSRKQNLHNRLLILEAENAKLRARLAQSSTATGMKMVYDELETLRVENRAYSVTVENLRAKNARLRDALGESLDFIMSGPSNKDCVAIVNKVGKIFDETRHV